MIIMKYEIQFARVTCYGKLQDRFLTCQHLKSPELTKQSMGDIFSLIEILSPWFPTAQIGQLIINNFSKFYYQGGSTSDLVNFEEALKKVNESLAEVTQNGETEWIGKLNGILAVMVEGNLHLALTGRAEGYLFREGKLNHLTADLNSDAEIHPLKTFSNVISGELKTHDKLLFANKDLLEHISIESIQQIITLNNASLAASQIVKLLRKARTKKVNLIILDLYSKEEISNENISQNLEEVYYLDKSNESVIGRLMTVLNSLILPPLKFLSGLIVGLKKRKKKIAPLPTLETQKKIPEIPPENNEDKFHREFLSDDNRDNLLKDEEINYSPDYVHYYNSQKNKKPRFENFLQIAKLLGQKIYQGLRTFWLWIWEMAKDKKRRKFLYIAGAIIIILILFLVIGAGSKKSGVGNLEAQKILDEANGLEKEGVHLLSSGDENAAKDKLSQAMEKLVTIETNPFVSADAANLMSQIYLNLDKLTSTTRFEKLTAINSLPENAKGLTVISGNAYAFTDEVIYKANLLGGSPEKVASIAKGKGSFVTASRSDKTIYFYTSNQYVFEFNTVNEQLIQTKISDSKWETANSIAYYSSSLYLLDGVVGQIYKHASSADLFKAGGEYIATSKVNLKQGISMAIDGSVYVLKSNGQAVKLEKSRETDFSLKDIPTPYNTLKEPTKIYTDADTPSIYVLDRGQKRILEFDKDGDFRHQYALPSSFDQLSDISVSIKSRKIWILEKNNIYEIDI